MALKTNRSFAPELDIDTIECVENRFQLIIWNDNVNTFDWVIQTLIDVCKHYLEQAEQCTLLVHYTGKCAVKSGSYEDLKPMQEAILDRGIQVSIEEAVS
ncbi:MAG: ATP-dependent Clp protease adaptor ClpS [Chitinophagaceae bacterium]|nr:MAG: Clp protease adaptor protein ClpS [Bacteroidetes bacterium OLB11]MCC6448517.1 ATP-dependent Clp protease adaptor ClpS [Chitinophagaceae bacterium]HMN32103.1 ATP-dependent Clp protease adaptor ClpS [Chitinophagaceae bacterium]